MCTGRTECVPNALNALSRGPRVLLSSLLAAQIIIAEAQMKAFLPPEVAEDFSYSPVFSEPAIPTCIYAAAFREAQTFGILMRRATRLVVLSDDYDELPEDADAPALSFLFDTGRRWAALNGSDNPTG